MLVIKGILEINSKNNSQNVSFTQKLGILNIAILITAYCRISKSDTYKTFSRFLYLQSHESNKAVKAGNERILRTIPV